MAEKWNAERASEIAAWTRQQWPSASARAVHRYAQIGCALERVRAQWREDPTPKAERDFAALRDALAVVATEVGVDPADPLPTLDHGFLPGDLSRLIDGPDGLSLKDQIWTSVLGRNLGERTDYKRRSAQ
ncbi:hypothetical protein [Gordonia sp. i37]|uniref:hypothetical protein n=1 Tax=Gordonia sp. i37 TaxID=1961707 RepID=UPI0009AD77D5|nr:hypothetical protein [Gordonia sp. i37]OPX14374.1 hypothetical protein B1964_15445 [Gordonia sp. i37]